MDIETFITERLDHQISYFDKAASREQQRGKSWQNYMIGAAAVTPVFIALAELGPEPWDTILRGLSLVSSALAAVATSVLATRKYWENGITYRAREQALIREKFLYRMKAGPYAKGASDLPAGQLLVENVEGLLAEDAAGWAERMKDASQRAQGHKAEEPDDADADTLGEPSETPKDATE